MSKSKGLEFDRSQPAFLQRLRGEISGQTGDPDRHLDAQARPKRPKRLGAEEDDGPTYVMEDTNTTLTKDEYDALVTGGENGAAVGANAADGSATDDKGEGQPKQTQKLGAIGAAKKRKVIKVIGGDEEVDEVKEKNEPTKSAKGEDGERKIAEKKGPKKKKAKVKMNFGDDDEET